jgi:hypothetical protein
LNSFQRATCLEPANWVAHFTFGCLLADLGRHDDALTMTNKPDLSSATTSELLDRLHRRSDRPGSLFATDREGVNDSMVGMLTSQCERLGRIQTSTIEKSKKEAIVEMAESQLKNARRLIGAEHEVVKIMERLIELTKQKIDEPPKPWWQFWR